MSKKKPKGPDKPKQPEAPSEGEEFANIEDAVKFLTGFTASSKSTTNENYAAGLLNTHEQVVQRNTLLTELLENYINQNSKKTKINNILKYIFFGLFAVILIALTTMVVVAVCRVHWDLITVPLMVSLLSVGATYFGSILVIYEIICKYLFPVDEEKDMISMIQTVINNDLSMEQFVSAANQPESKKSGDAPKPDANPAAQLNVTVTFAREEGAPAPTRVEVTPAPPPAATAPAPEDTKPGAKP